MPVRIRLRRVGAKKQPTYRVVVADSRSPRDGRFVESIGHYNPRTDPATVVVDRDRARYWLKNGAQPSETVARLLHREGLVPAPWLAKGSGTAATTADAEAAT